MYLLIGYISIVCVYVCVFFKKKLKKISHKKRHRLYKSIIRITNFFSFSLSLLFYCYFFILLFFYLLYLFLSTLIFSQLKSTIIQKRNDIDSNELLVKKKKKNATKIINIRYLCYQFFRFFFSPSFSIHF